MRASVCLLALRRSGLMFGVCFIENPGLLPHAVT